VSIYAADMQQVKLWHSRLSQPMIQQKRIQYGSTEVNLRSSYIPNLFFQDYWMQSISNDPQSGSIVVIDTFRVTLP
jgi:hypothetical protein